MQSAREQKERSDRQHQVELTALSSNLASLRQQGENNRKKIEQYDKKLKGLTEDLEGRGLTEIVRMVVRVATCLYCIHVCGLDSKSKRHSEQEEHRILLEK